MTLLSFALETRAVGQFAYDEALMSKVETAVLVSDALQARGNVHTQRLMPGAGLCLDGSRLVPTVLADRSTLDPPGDGLIPIDEVSLLRNELRELLDGWPDNVAAELRVLPVAEGVRHTNPGTEIRGPNSGRIGPHVHWGSGAEGFLTAGHVAQSAGATVTDTSGASIGSVLWSNDPALAPSTTGDLDAALVEFDPAHNATTGRSAIVASAGQALTVAVTGHQADVLGFFDHVLLGSAQACYAQCYATDQKITQNGDSGGLVEAQGDVVGTVIGAYSKRDMTLVQAIDYQLREVRKRSGHMVSL